MKRIKFSVAKTDKYPKSISTVYNMKFEIKIKKFGGICLTKKFYYINISFRLKNLLFRTFKKQKNIFF